MLKKTFFVILCFLLLGAIGQRVLPIKYAQLAYDKINLLQASAFGLKTETISVDDMEIHYLTNRTLSDTRPVILLLHGYSSDKYVWIRFARYFLDDYQLIIPDLAGHGDTGFQAQWDYSGPAQAERMRLLLDKLNISRVHVMGNSMGGFISAHMSLRNPQRVISAVLFDPGGVRSTVPSEMNTMRENGRDPFEVNSRSEFDEFFAMTMAKPPWLPEFIKRAISKNYQERKPQLRIINDGFRKKDQLDDVLSEIETPVLLLWGEEDRLLHVSSATNWKAGVPNIRVQVLPGIGHMPMLEAPSDSASRVQKFLSGLVNTGP